MNKKITAALVAVLLAVPATAQANLKNRTVGSAPTLAVIDTAINSSDPVFNGKVVHEVCILAVKINNCANGSNYMEGKGAALVPDSVLYNTQYLPGNGFDHGSIMALSAIKANPNMNIVFIRIAGYKANGSRENVGPDLVTTAINWVVSNKDKFNIKAINVSQGSSNLRSGTDYCPKVPTLSQAITNSIASNVPVFFPTGNKWNPTRVDFPACIPEAISIAAVEDDGRVAGYTNHDPNLTDFFVPGFFEVNLNNKQIRSIGTSVSSARAAAYWVLISSSKPNLTYTQMYDLLVKTSVYGDNSKIQTNRVMNVAGALNG